MRTSVRSISDEDMICALSHRPELRIGLGGMNAESYAASGNWSKKDNARFPCKYFQMSKIEDLMPEWACLLRPLAETYPGSTQKAADGRENEEDHQQRKCVKQDQIRKPLRRHNYVPLLLDLRPRTKFWRRLGHF